ncbi:AIR synthase-related protein, partial [Rhodoblastus sp.]|uniref:AIR synthase-related protein n=1 Tax=Rhodoblastus sp. TaxID=1962975 RepID=UPI003F964433
LAGEIGATVAAHGADQPAIWFGEDQGRYLLTAWPDMAEEVCAKAREAGVAVAIIGETGGEALRLGASEPLLVRELLDAHENWMPSYMAGGGKTA